MSKENTSHKDEMEPLNEQELNQTLSKETEAPIQEEINTVEEKENEPKQETIEPVVDKEEPQKKNIIAEDDFLKVVALENGEEIENTIEATEKIKTEEIKPKEQNIEKSDPDIPQSQLESVLEKAGVKMSGADLAIAHEMIHSVRIMDNKPNRMALIGGKLAGINTLIERYPELAPYAYEFSRVFENSAKNPETKKFMQENYLNSVREKFGSAQTVESEVGVEKNIPQNEKVD